MPNRRDFLRTAAAAGAPAILRSRAPERPNILFLFGDDWARCAGVYRDPKRPGMSDAVRTPNVDRIAREGVLFTNAFMATPSCTPSRAAVATGCYSFRTGSTANLRGGSWKGRLDPGSRLPGFGRLLEESGYLLRDSHKTLAPTWLGGKKLERRLSIRYSAYVSEAATAAEQARRREEFIEQARKGIRQTLSDRAAGQPFCYVFGPINTHRPWVWQSGTKLWKIDQDSLSGRLPAFLPDNPVIRQDVADYLGEVQAFDLFAGCFLEELEKAGELDRTMVVLSGDNGMGGMPRGKCNLYDFGVHAPLVVRWPGHGKAGRTVSDFVNLMDLAPTFLEAGGLKPPETMNGRSLVPLLSASKSGVVDPTRDFVVVSRERHVGDARAGNLPYPSRAIRTTDHLYVRNFKPERWPMGDPIGLDGPGKEPSYEELASDTMVTFKDHDASPTKAWMVTHRKDPEVRRLYDLAFSRRPAEELYDLKKDPDQVRNVAADPAYTGVKQRLDARLMKVLRDAADPRLDDAFDRPPYVEEG
jgi:N-sulfoglucosamine sulfohydrolase